MEEKKEDNLIEICIDFYPENYLLGYNKVYYLGIKRVEYVKRIKHIRNKEFMFCCDLLKLKEYEEFDGKVKKEYWTYDNCYMVMDALKMNDINHIKFIMKYIKTDLIYYNSSVICCTLLDYCIKNCSFDVTRYLVEQYNLKYTYNINIMSNIVVQYSDQLFKVKKLSIDNINNIPSLYYYAALNNDLDFMKKLFRLNYRHTDLILLGAAISGNLEIIKWVYANGFENRSPINMKKGYIDRNERRVQADFQYELMRNGHIKCFKYILNRGYAPNVFAIYGAAENGNIENIHWLLDWNKIGNVRNFTLSINRRTEIYSMYEYFLVYGIMSINIKTIKWILQCPLQAVTVRSFELALDLGNVKIITLLAENYKDILNWEIAEYLSDRYYPIIHMTSLQYIFNIKGIKYDDQCMNEILHTKDIELIEYVYKFTKINTKTIATALYIGNINILRWLINNNCKYNYNELKYELQEFDIDFTSLHKFMLESLEKES